jgi:hypothetical protein
MLEAFATVVTLLDIPATVVTLAAIFSTAATSLDIPATAVTSLDTPATVLTFAAIPDTVLICPCSVLVGLIEIQEEPSRTYISSELVFQYKAPAIKASPSLSTDGADDLAPRYLSSNESKDDAELVALVAALLALVDAAEALLAAAVAEAAASLAEVSIATSVPTSPE